MHSKNIERTAHKIILVTIAYWQKTRTVLLDDSQDDTMVLPEKNLPPHSNPETSLR